MRRFTGTSSGHHWINQWVFSTWAHPRKHAPASGPHSTGCAGSTPSFASYSTLTARIESRNQCLGRVLAAATASMTTGSWCNGKTNPAPGTALNSWTVETRLCAMDDKNWLCLAAHQRCAFHHSLASCCAFSICERVIDASIPCKLFPAFSSPLALLRINHLAACTSLCWTP